MNRRELLATLGSVGGFSTAGCLDENGVSPLWHFETGFGVFSSPTIVDGVVCVGSEGGNLYAIDAGVGGSSADSRVLSATLGHSAG